MADKPGRYESPLEEYPGHVQFPHPFMLHHVEAWWAEAVEAVEGVKRTKLAAHMGEWNAAVTLILEYGEWAVEGVPVGDVKEGHVPAEVLNWVMEVADEYIPPFLPSRVRRLAQRGT